MVLIDVSSDSTLLPSLFVIFSHLYPFHNLIGQSPSFVVNPITQSHTCKELPIHIHVGERKIKTVLAEVQTIRGKGDLSD